MEAIDYRVIYRSRKDQFTLYPLGDIHAGSIACVEDEIRRVVEEIKNDPKALWIGMGDYCECITKADKRWRFNRLAPWVKHNNIVESQREWMRDLLMPIKDKCICLLDGNHELTIMDAFQYWLTINLCKDLGVPYGGYHCMIDLIFNRISAKREAAENPQLGSKTSYRIHAWHGAGSAQTEGARLMRLVRLVNDIESDIYLMGHLHAMTSHTPDRLVKRGKTIKSQTLLATLTGSWLKGYMQQTKAGAEPIPPDYIEGKGYKPSRIGCPKIVLTPDKQTFELRAKSGG